MQSIEDGSVSDAQIQSRARMYIHSTVEGYWKGRGRSATSAGYDEVNWYLGSTENHCEDCPSIASSGWQPVCAGGGFPYGGSCHYPGDGQTECLTNCRCSLEYRKSETGVKFDG